MEIEQMGNNQYPEERDKTAVIGLAVIDDPVNFLQSTPPFGYQLHGLLVPTMQPSLTENKAVNRLSTIHRRLERENGVLELTCWLHRRRPTPAGPRKGFPNKCLSISTSPRRTKPTAATPRDGRELSSHCGFAFWILTGNEPSSFCLGSRPSL